MLCFITLFLNKGNRNYRTNIKRCLTYLQNESFTKPVDIFNLSKIMLEMFFGYVKSKQQIPDSVYNNKVANFLNVNSLQRDAIPIELLQLVEGIEIWLTVSLCLLYSFIKLLV